MDDRLFQFHQAAKPRLLERQEDQPTHAPMRAGIKPADRRAPSTDQKKVRTQQRRKTAGFGIPGDPTEYGVGGDHCPHCGADWKQPHDGGCLRNTNPAQAAALEAEGEVALAAENARYKAEHGASKTAALGNPKVVRVPPWAQGDQGSIYDWTQTSDDIKDGDVFVDPYGVVGFLMKAWPILVSGPDEGVLHGVEGGDLDATVAKWKGEGDDYTASLALARQQKPTGREWSDIPHRGSLTDGSLWDDVDSGDTSRTADFSWHMKADPSGQGVSSLPDANEAEKPDCGAKDNGLVCQRPKGHDGPHDYQPVQGETQKAAANDQFLYRYDSGQPGGVRRVSKQWRSKACSPGGSGDCEQYFDDGKECECWCHGEEAMDLWTGMSAKEFHEKYVWPRGKPSFASLSATAAQPSTECPKCGAKIDPVQVTESDGSTVLKGECSACGWQGRKTKKASKTAAAPDHFAADLAKVQQALEEGGFVVTHDDGFQSISPNAPEDLVRIYRGLMQAGYANGWLASKTAEVGEPERTDCPKCGSGQFNVAAGFCPQCGYRKEAKTAMQDLPFMDWYKIVQHGYNALTGSYLEADVNSADYHRAHEQGWGPEKAIQAFCASFGKPVSLMDAMQAVDRAGQHHQLWSSKTAAYGRCERCDGKGYVGIVIGDPEDPYGTEVAERECPDCGGTGEEPEYREESEYPLADDPIFDRYSSRSSSMNPSQREAQILQAMAKATPAEQKDLAIELEALRTAARAHAQEERDLDWANGVIRDTLTPVATHQANSAATDWIADIGTESAYSDQVDHQVRAEATLWYQRTGAEVAEFDPEEFLEQAMGMARRTASLHNDVTGRAERSFVEHACHLAGLKVSYEHGDSEEAADYAEDALDAPDANSPWPLDPDSQQPGPNAEHRPDNWPITSPEGQTTSALSEGSMWDAIEIVASPGVGDADPSGQGVSSLPNEVPLKGNEEVMDNLAPPVAPINEGIAFNEPTSADAPIVQENMQDPPETSTGGGNAGDIADPSGQGVSKLPTPNASVHTAKDGDTAKCAICGKDIEQQDYAWYHLSKDGPTNWEEHGPQTYPAPGTTSSLHTAEDNGGAQTCEVCGDTITRDPEGESPRTYHHTNGTKHDHEAKPKSSEAALRPATADGAGETGESPRTAAVPIADPSGQGVSGLPQVDDTVEETMWPWELDANTPGTGAADVAAVPTPGGEAGYPPVRATLHEAAKCGPCNLGNHTGSNGTGGCRGGSCTCSCRKTSSLSPEQAAFRARVQSSLRG